MSNNKLGQIIHASLKPGQIIHASLKPVVSSNTDFPNSEPTLGVLCRAVFHKLNNRIMVEIYHESPIVISPGKGEFFEADIDNIDSKTRELLLSIAQRCRVQGEELIQQSERLIEIASQERIIDEINEGKVLAESNARVIPGATVNIGSNSNFIVSATESITKTKRERAKRGRKAAAGDIDDLLSILEEESGEGGSPGDQEEKTSSVSSDDILDMLDEIE